MAALMGTRDAVLALGSVGGNSGGPYSPAKEKAATRGGAYNGRWSAVSVRRIRVVLGAAAKVRILLAACGVFAFFLIVGRIGSLMGWDPHPPSSVSSPTR